MTKVAVLTNDLQYDLVEKNRERIEAVAALKTMICGFLDNIRKLDHLVVHLQLINLPDDPNAERYNGYLPVQKGTRGADIIDDFYCPQDIIVEKNKDSGFFETNLDAVLKKHHVETVIISGMQTQICVQTTAADAFFRGYNVWVPRDAVVSARPEDKERALIWLDEYCATISSTDDIISLLKEGGQLERKTVCIP